MGIDYLLTSVWQHNQRSHYVLQKIGFEPLGYKQGADIHQEIHYVLPLQTTKLTKAEKKNIQQQFQEEADEK